LVVKIHISVLAFTCLLAAGSAKAQPAPLPPPDPRAVLNFVTENDSYGLNNSDRWYTNGIRLGYSSPEAALPGPVAALDEALANIFGAAQSRWGLAIGQNMYTPRDLRRSPPDPNDRPYAGYLYLEGSLDRRTSNTLDRFTVQLGVVGPSALGKEAQDFVHSIIGGRKAQGWHYQLQDEPTFNLGWQRTWRYHVASLPYGLDTDVLPSLELAAGTVAVYAQTGARFRIGQGLNQDFGPPRIRPGGSDAPAPVGEGFGWYVFGGASGRLVGRDIFLDGNTWRSHSPSVDKNILVGDFEVGAAMFWHNVRLSYTHDWRSEEFSGQKKFFTFGSISLSVAF
jgi:lipid A 3-O-deacylase